jgi:glycosyltransferase involved in cell wall biosynthesis
LVARQAVATIVTNDHWAALVRSWRANAVSIAAIPTELLVGESPQMKSGFNVTVVNSWSRDEPIGAILSAAQSLPEVWFNVTGPRAGAKRLTASTPPNVRFTGLLSQASYNGLLASSDAVLCLTTHDNTMQNGACEALTLGTPVVTSDWPILRRCFEGAAVYVRNEPDGIVEGLRQLMADSRPFREEISRVRGRREEEWHQTRRALLEQISKHRVSPRFTISGRPRHPKSAG